MALVGEIDQIPSVLVAELIDSFHDSESHAFDPGPDRIVVATKPTARFDLFGADGQFPDGFVINVCGIQIDPVEGLIGKICHRLLGITAMQDDRLIPDLPCEAIADCGESILADQGGWP